MTNTAADLYTQIDILEPGRSPLGSSEAFIARLEDDPGATFAQATFDRLILRRTKEQCLDLPEKSYMDIRVELPGWQRRVYDQMRDEMVAEVRSMTGEQYRTYAATALSKLTRLIQIASNPALIFPEAPRGSLPSSRRSTVSSRTSSRCPGGKSSAWSSYIRTIESLLGRLPAAVAIYGATPAGERLEIARRFQEDPDTRVLIAESRRGRHRLHSDRGQFHGLRVAVLEVHHHYAQSQDRNHRIGQTVPVTYLRLSLAADTIEEAVVTALERKSALARGLLGDRDAGEAVAQMTQEQMCELLTGNRLPAEQDRTAAIEAPQVNPQPMHPRSPRAAVGDNMSRIRARDTQPEMRLRSALHRAGLRFRVCRNDLPGRPDISLSVPARDSSSRLFLAPAHGVQRRPDSLIKCRLLAAKAAAHLVERDAEKDQTLRTLGWCVLVVWECDLKTDEDVARAVRRVALEVGR